MKPVPAAIVALCALALAPAAHAQSPVVIDWDQWSVAHVQAPDLASGGYGLGWAQMETRGETIAATYLMSRGEAAACVGESMLPSDVRVRQLGVPERAAAWLADQDPEVVSLLTGFADGMNAWLAAHPDRNGALACLSSVTAADPLALVQMTLHVAVVAFGSEQMITSWRDPRSSNAYAVAPSRTADGRSLLLVNPHSAWAAPFLSYEAHLITPELNLYGQTFPGLPLPFAGFTDDHGWALTFNDIDGIDAYTLQRVEGGYRFGGEVLPFKSREVAVQVRGVDGTLTSRSIDAPDLSARRTPLAQRARPAFAVKALDDGGYWLSMPSFDGSPGGAAHTARTAMIAEATSKQSEVRAAPYGILDLRGNGGGSLHWNQTLAARLGKNGWMRAHCFRGSR